MTKKEFAILVRLDGEERDRLSKAAFLDGRPLAQWARMKLLMAADDDAKNAHDLANAGSRGREDHPSARDLRRADAGPFVGAKKNGKARR